MGDVFDYIEWRGDISMKNDPVNDVDMLIFCRLAYIPFDDIVPNSIKDGPVTLRQAAIAVLNLVKNAPREFRKKEDKKLLELLLNCPRFRNIRLHYFLDIYNEELEEQFCAITMELEDGTVAVIYRGTDGTLVGWKEDFNMSFSPEIPAQRDSVKYLEKVAGYFPEMNLRVAGHSKGGNLSMYAATYCEAKVQKRIIAVRNLDGPGFNEYQASPDDFKKIEDVTLTYLPDSSIIGMLLEHMEKSVIIDSLSLGLFQHNVYLWRVRRGGFVEREVLNNSSYLIDNTLKDWLKSLTPLQREQMIDGIFEVLQSSNGKTLRELWNGKNAFSILSKVTSFDFDTWNNIENSFKLFRKAIKNNINARNVFDNLIEKKE